VSAAVVSEVPPSEVYAAALRGAPCTATIDGREVRLPVRRWAGGITAGDRFLLAHCEGPTIDLGCGPGRLTAELTRRGVRTLGVDVSGEAVEAATARCAPVLRADLFGPLPGEGHWRTALLADGNVGIGGAPAALLRRVRGLVTPGGRVVFDCASPGTGVRVRVVHLRAGGLTSEPFPWAEVGVDALGSLAADAGLVLAGASHWRGRWVATLHRPALEEENSWPR
jgi:SAM-dependent methyltransferase